MAAEFSKDLSISDADIRVPDEILKGDTGRIYVTVHNNSNTDLSGVVKFYDESTSSYIGTDQPVSVLSDKTDDVFVDWSSDKTGNHPISVRIIPWDSDGDDPDNNKVTKDIYIDIDTDHDGIGDRLDNDDDNDGVPDNQDAFPLNYAESKDTDRDGIGDNADTDDDNDGVPDVQDIFPADANEWKDSDSDGVGDNGDAFPYDASETKDSDSDGLGDNSDPNNSNKGPVPDISVANTDIKTGEVVTFNAIKSRDPDGSVVEYSWDFGDGMTDRGVIIDHSFKKAGDYLVSLKTVDDKGEPREKQIRIKVRSGLVLTALMVTSVLLILMILGLIIPGGRFYYKRLFRSESKKRKSKK